MIQSIFSKIKNQTNLLFLVLLAGVLNIYDIRNLGFGNTYYASAIKSMMTSFSNFFFVSFDSSGFISVDKAPLSLWVDTFFAKIFGFSGVSILLPHALEGILVTLLVYKIVEKIGGKIPAFIASLAITISPVNVAVYRNNTPDALLLVFVLLAVWFVLKFFERQKIKYLLLSGLMLGFGFNTKMLQAYLILPAIASAVFIFSHGGIGQKIKNTGMFLAVTILVSLSWISIVDLTPAHLRPYVGGSENNSAWNLALAYNGAERLLGESSVGGNPGFNLGQKSLLRLFQGEMGTQAGWLLLSVLLFSAYFVSRNFKKIFSKLRGLDVSISLYEIFTFMAIVFFVTEFIFFSFASFFHSYYLNIFTIAIAFLTGSMVYELRKGNFRNNVLTYMLLAALPVQIYLISQADYASWLIPVLLIAGVFAFLMVLLQINTKMRMAGMIVLVLSLFLTPFIWSGYTTVHADTATAIFIGGPSVRNGGRQFGVRGFGGGQPFGGNGGNGQGGPFGSWSVEATTLKYLKQQYNGEKYFVAVASQAQATSFILDDDIGNVMTLGGFSGRDKVLTLAQFQELIKSGQLRFFLTQNRMGGPGGFGGFAGIQGFGFNGMPFGNTGNRGPGGGMFNANQEINNWVTANCKAINGINSLYDCKL